jgi:hypothetical protein
MKLTLSAGEGMRLREASYIGETTDWGEGSKSALIAMATGLISLIEHCL